MRPRHHARARGTLIAVLAVAALLSGGCGNRRRQASPSCTSDAECDDHQLCNGTERCLSGHCEPGSALTCDDDDPCTRDSCSAERNACVHLATGVDEDYDGVEGTDCGGIDCDDHDPLRVPGRFEICGNDIDEDCDNRATDMDCDGSVGIYDGGDDCDDEDPGRFPGNLEMCGNEVDEDCDGIASDQDCDGHDIPQNGGEDCNDRNPAVHPGAPEVPNGIDDDCDGQVDEGTTAAGG
jgi:hypothetical protein